MSGGAPALEAAGVSKGFPGVRALDRVDLRLEAGTIHALLGENGAGKSTLVKIVTGVHAPDGGELRLAGRPVRLASPRDAIRAGVGAVHQERNLVARFSVGENIALERLPARLGLVDYRRVHAEARRRLDELGLDLDPRTPVAELGVAQMQLVEIAKGLALEARVLLLDEPTASITPHEAGTLFALLRRLRGEGVAIVFVSHKLEEVFELCDRVTVLRDGRNACSDEALAGLGRGDLVRLMVGRDEAARPPAVRATAGEVALELEGVSTAFGHRDVSLSLRRGEILGLYGLVGAGRSELAKAVIGAVRVTAGAVRVRGREARIGSPGEALRRWRIGYVSEDRKGEGLILAHSLRRNVAITVWHRLAGAFGLVTAGAERRVVQPLVERLAIRAPSQQALARTLSGGNQQKVSVAKWLAAGVDILIVDEPTVGVDVRTKAHLHELLRELARGGTAVLLISSDMPEMVALADRILVMRRARIAGEVPGGGDYAAASRAIMGLIHEEAAGSSPSAVPRLERGTYQLGRDSVRPVGPPVEPGGDKV